MYLSFESCFRSILSKVIIVFRKVEREIADCRVPGNLIEWRELCQDLLRQSYGMNLPDLLILLEFVLQRRLKILESHTHFLVFEEYSFGPNHVKFDIRKIGDVTKFLLSEFKSLELENYVTKCEEILLLCQIQWRLWHHILPETQETLHQTPCLCSWHTVQLYTGCHMHNTKKQCSVTRSVFIFPRSENNILSDLQFCTPKNLL